MNTRIWKIVRMYRAITRKIEVTVEPAFMPERSVPDKGSISPPSTAQNQRDGAAQDPLADHHRHHGTQAGCAALSASSP
jgi:hypothetical protein